MKYNLEDYAKCRVLLYHGKGIISGLIRWQTRSMYSHSGILLPDGTSVGALYNGVVISPDPLSVDPGMDKFIVNNITNEQWKIACDFILSQLGKGYDYWAIIRFVSRESMPDNDRWFCSELVFTALQKAGINLLKRVPPSEVSPGAMSHSTLLTLDD